MRRIDRLLDEARLLRAKRAARAQGKVPAAPDEADWLAESAAAQAILESLCESEEVHAADPRRRVGRLDVLDIEVLAPFVDRCEAALAGVIAEMAPADVVAASLLPRVCAATSPALVAILDRQIERAPADCRSGDGAGAAARVKDPLGPRRDAVRDIAVLTVESALFEVLRRTFEAHDLARPVSVRAHTGDVVVRDGKVTRPRRDLKGRRARKAVSDAKKAARASGAAYVAPLTDAELARRRLAAPRIQRVPAPPVDGADEAS